MIGRVLRIFLALVLVGVLAFLYVMSQGGDLKRQTQIVADLRNLKEIDTRWNRDVAAARSEAMNAEARTHEPIALERVLDDLSSETEALDNRALSGVEVRAVPSGRSRGYWSSSIKPTQLRNPERPVAS
jgi:hypothetical protein